MPPAPTVTVVGAGALGAAMAVRLGETGHQVRLWNRTADRARAAAAQAVGVTAVESLGQALWARRPSSPSFATGTPSPG